MIMLYFTMDVLLHLHGLTIYSMINIMTKYHLLNQKQNKTEKQQQTNKQIKQNKLFC